LADRLNNEYLHEEWDFGLEKLEADKSKFKEPPVICGQSRIQMVRKTSYQVCLPTFYHDETISDQNQPTAKKIKNISI
jgi:hypothetical protein